MDYEKAYKDALERAKKFKSPFCQHAAEVIFPELRENEDERIRKWCISHFKECINVIKDNDEYKEYLSNKVLAWLEKQAEPQTYKGNADTMRKNLIKAFKSVGGNHWGGFDVRDIIHFLESKDAIELERQGDYNRLVEEIKERKELISKEKEKATSTNDKLSLGGRIAILEELLAFTKEKQGEQKPADKVEPKFKVGDWIVYETEGWREVLQIETIDEHYTFTNGSSSSFDEEQYIRLWTIEDAKDGDVLAIGNEYFLFKEKKENISPAVYISHCFSDSSGAFRVTNGRDCGEFLSIENGVKACPATKEQCEALFKAMHEAGYEWDAEKKELKKIEKIDEKHKVGEYFTGLIPCWINAPSTQQPAHNYHGKNIVAIHLKDGGYRCCCIDDKKPVTFSLPENTSLVEGWKRKSTEWSEDDEKIMKRICDYFENEGYQSGADDFDRRVFGENISWLKSLKPQPHWKPTDEQMQSLYFAIITYSKKDDCKLTYDGLNSLYDNLKKL